MKKNNSRITFNNPKLLLCNILETKLFDEKKKEFSFCLK